MSVQRPRPRPVRVDAALSEPMAVEKIAPGMFRVQSLGSDEAHTVDVVGGACQCEDFQYRETYCKHLAHVAFTRPSEVVDA
jgi:hypothetical protein